MGIDRNQRSYSSSRSKKDFMNGPRIWLPLDMLQGSAYASLSFSAKALLLDLTAQLRGSGGIKNNGDLATAFTILSKSGWKDEKTIRKAAKELENVSLIIKTRQGYRPNKCNLYAVTWLPLNEMDKLDVTAKGFPLNAYKLLDKPIPIKSKRDQEKIPISDKNSGKNSLSKDKRKHFDREKIPLSATF